MKKIKLIKQIILEFEDRSLNDHGVLIVKNEQHNKNAIIILDELTPTTMAICPTSKTLYLSFMELALPLIVCKNYETSQSWSQDKIYETAGEIIATWTEEDFADMIYPTNFFKKYRESIIKKLKESEPNLTQAQMALMCPTPHPVIFPKLKKLKAIDMAKSFGDSAAKFIKAGMPKVSPKQFEERLQACKTCDLWDSSGFGGTGRCKKCGCSTWAKLRMATERCPIGKWEPVLTTQP